MDLPNDDWQMNEDGFFKDAGPPTQAGTQPQPNPFAGAQVQSQAHPQAQSQVVPQQQAGFQATPPWSDPVFGRGKPGGRRGLGMTFLAAAIGAAVGAFMANRWTK